MYGKQIYEVCGSGNCGSESYGVDYAKAVTHWALAELLKEKIKQRMDKLYGAKLDKIADLVAEVVTEQNKSDKSVEEKADRLEKLLEEIKGD